MKSTRWWNSCFLYCVWLSTSLTRIWQRICISLYASRLMLFLCLFVCRSSQHWQLCWEEASPRCLQEHRFFWVSDWQTMTCDHGTGHMFNKHVGMGTHNGCEILAQGSQTFLTLTLLWESVTSNHSQMKVWKCVPNHTLGKMMDFKQPRNTWGNDWHYTLNPTQLCIYYVTEQEGLWTS